MNLPTEISNRLHQFCNPKVVFSEGHQQFLFSSHWLNEIADAYFQDEVFELMVAFSEVLKISTKPKSLIEDLLMIIDRRLDWLEEKELGKIDKFHTYAKAISSFTIVNNDPPTPEKYSIKQIVKASKQTIVNIQQEENYYQDLWRFKDQFHQYSNPFDFEMVKLYSTFNLHRDFILKIYSCLDQLKMDLDQINFLEFDFEAWMLKHGIANLEHFKMMPQKCHLSLTKKEVATLFLTLQDLEYITFNQISKSKKRISLAKFIQNNFTYEGQDKKKTEIKNINQTFSELTYPNKLERNAFLKKLHLDLPYKSDA